MHCFLKICILAVLLVATNVSSNIIRASEDDISTKDVPVPKDDEVEEVGVITVNLPEEVPEENVLVAETNEAKQCAEVGQFCYAHSQCCSNACLGYMKRCVSG